MWEKYSRFKKQFSLCQYLYQHCETSFDTASSCHCVPWSKLEPVGRTV